MRIYDTGRRLSEFSHIVPREWQIYNTQDRRASGCCTSRPLNIISSGSKQEARIQYTGPLVSPTATPLYMPSFLAAAYAKSLMGKPVRSVHLCMMSFWSVEFIDFDDCLHLKQRPTLFYQIPLWIILSRVLVTCRRDLDLQWDLLHLTHSHSSGLQAIQRCRYSTHFPLHRYTRSRVISLH
jgi:hypothetical protein